MFDVSQNNPHKGRIPKRWDKNPVQEILPEGRIINRVLLIEGYLHISTFYSGRAPGSLMASNVPVPSSIQAPSGWSKKICCFDAIGGYWKTPCLPLAPSSPLPPS